VWRGAMKIWGKKTRYNDERVDPKEKRRKRVER
jgi:hypothetical protein